MKWQSTRCGYFERQNMSFNELRYHVRRMWGRYGFKEVIVNDNVINLFKFKYKEGMCCMIGNLKHVLSVTYLDIALKNVTLDQGLRKRIELKLMHRNK